MPLLKTMHTAFDLLPDAVLYVDGRLMSISDVNHAACACLGYTCEELRGMGLQELCPPQDVVALAKQFESMQDTEPATATRPTSLRVCRNPSG